MAVAACFVSAVAAAEEEFSSSSSAPSFQWLIANGDMHLKHGLPEDRQTGDQQFRSVRMAPLYDAVTKGDVHSRGA